MATINGVDIEKVKEQRIKKLKQQERAIKRMRKESQNISTTKQEYEHKTDVLGVYNDLSDDEKKALVKQLEKKKIRDSYIKYLQYTHKNYTLTKFHAFLGSLCQWVVEQVEKGEKIRICLSVPRQHGKSYSVTESLPSWFLGRNPDLRCIVTGYNADIAEKFGDKNRQLVKQHGKDLFGIEISDSQDNKTLWDLAQHEGGMLSTGILGSLTGNGGALIIVDDPFKNEEEANNPELREKVYRNFASCILAGARGGKAGVGNAVIVIHTRWHDDDLIGRLEKLGGWTIINVPAVWKSEYGIDKLLGRKVGQTLCPELGFDEKWAVEMERTLGKKMFNTLMQGKPYVEGGNIVKREYIRYYDKNSLPTNFEELTLSCDLTFGGTKSNNDPYCMTLWGRNKADHYLLKIYDKKASFIETLRTIRVICGEYPELRRKLVEKKANGQATIDMLGREIGGFTPYDPKNTSKENRLQSVVPYFEGGNVYFPCEDLMPNIEDYVSQLLRFPNATHDDFVDTISQYLLNYEYRYSGKINTNSTMGLLAEAIRGY